MKDLLSRVTCLLALLFLAAFSLHAQSVESGRTVPAEKQIPEPLKAWESWATWDDEHRLCPTPYSDAKKHLCFWPSQLALDVQQTAGKFDLTVTVFHETWVPLPGSADAWPSAVLANGAAVPVVEHASGPAVRLMAGTHQIAGVYRWAEYPQVIRLPREIGLLALVIEGQAVESPVWDAEGSLWLRRDKSSEETDKDSLQLKAYALLEDGVPLWLRMELELTVSGKSREEDLGTILPAGWKLSAVESPIPVAVNEAGRAKAQVRAGTWLVQVSGFRSDNPVEIRYAEGVKPVAAEVLVAFGAQPRLRMVEIVGAAAVDVSQAIFPEKWKELPVYRWKTGEAFRVEERMRGMGEQKAAGLSITRELWLDEGGRGLTFRDRITGQRQQIWRLDAAPGQLLGSVRSSGEGQLITRNPQTSQAGVEIRTRDLDLEATGQIERAQGLPATGWSTDAEALNATLNLPPGWRLFALWGADWVEGDWLTAWTLLDLFLLLIFTLAVFRLWGVGPAVLAFLAFGLAYHEPGSPRFTWLVLLVPLALLRAVPAGWGQRVLIATKWGVIAALAFVLIPFIAGQVQQALYPQLEELRSYSSGSPLRPADSRSMGSVPASAAPTAPSRSEIQEKLERIILPRLDLREATIREAVDGLAKQSVALDTSEPDSAKRGVKINLRIDPSAPEPITSAPAIPGLERLPGNQASSPPQNPNEARITVSLANIPLGEALRYVTGLANLKFKVEQDSVSVVSQGTTTESLVTREFMVVPGTIPSRAALGGTDSEFAGGGPGIARRSQTREALEASGVTFPEGASAIYLPGTSKLIVRNTQANLELVDAIASSSTHGPMRDYAFYDPNAQIQTGPGIPDWSWRTVTFGWNGPVLASQQVHPWFIPSWLERLLSILRVMLILALATVLLNGRHLGASLFRARGKAAATAVLALLCLSATASAQTQIPDSTTLDKLRERLLKPSDAYPRAADIPSATLKLEGRRITIDAEIHAAVETAVPLPGRLPAWSPVSVLIDDKPEAALRREDGYLWVVVPQGVHRVRVEGQLANVTEWEWTFLLKPRQVTIDAPGWTVNGVRPNGVPEQQVFLVRQQEAAVGEASYDRPDLQAIVAVRRSVNLGLRWQVQTYVRRLSPPGKAVALRIPLLPGESVLSSGAVVKDGFIEVRLGAQETYFTWDGALPFTDRLAFATRPEDTWVEQWEIDPSPVWNIAIAGLPPIFETGSSYLHPVWQPWPGEKVDLAISRPEPLAGASVTVTGGTHLIALGKRQRVSTLELSLRCSVGQDFLIDLPAEAQVTSLALDGQPIPVRKDGAKIIVPLRPGDLTIALAWKIDMPFGLRSPAETVGLPVASANLQTTIKVPENRWVLWANGPQRGPAVRFWGILICSLLAAVVLGRLAFSPLRTAEWMLLVIGLTQVPLLALLVVIGWLFLLAWRGDASFQPSVTWQYNLLQAFIVALTLGALGILVFAVAEGLLGRPEMFISGNDSSRTVLRWYQARSDGLLPAPTCLTVSIWWYRFLMLGWALWLAAALLRWLSMGWKNFSSGGLFRSLRKHAPPPLPVQA